MTQLPEDGTHGTGATRLVLGIDTCGPSGSVALGRLVASGVEIMAQKELAGRSYSAMLVSSIGDLLNEIHAEFGQVRAIVVVNGPGSFTGVRVGLSAAKGLAEGRAIGVVPVSRLEVLAFKAQTHCAALDAHRHELFLRLKGANLDQPDLEAVELLAGREELAAINPPPTEMALCDDGAAELLTAVWPAVRQVRVEPPSAADALALCPSRIVDGAFADLAQLDGHYLRRSDAEIFGQPGGRRS